MSRPPRAAIGASLTTIVVASTAALAQEYPSRPLRLIVPNSPGTQVDSVSRIVSVDMQKLLGQPVVVENRPGANGVVGYEYVVQAQPDGDMLVTIKAYQCPSFPS
jgi:tripartite-type tricarboxylate transporter receptor subunit TctC